VLDWGCGTGEYRPLVTALGRRYTGFDLDGSGADVRGDAHALPFRDAVFDHVITNAVLEHVADPFAAAREIARVLRAAGRLSGSVAFLEPHHAGSHFHLSPDAVVHVLNEAGLRVEALWPQEHWLVFDSLAAMPGPITAPTRLGLRVLARVERLLRSRHLHPRAIVSGRWLRARDDAELRDERLVITGQVDFLARKP
jgi:SAM-dependent methyltransferase